MTEMVGPIGRQSKTRTTHRQRLQVIEKEEERKNRRKSKEASTKGKK